MLCRRLCLPSLCNRHFLEDSNASSQDDCCLHLGCAEAWSTSRRKPSSSHGEHLFALCSPRRPCQVQGGSSASHACTGQAWRRSLSALRHGATILLPYSFAFHRAAPSRAPGLGVFGVLHGVGRMFDVFFLDGTLCNGMNADRRLSTFARATWLSTLCSEVPRLVTIVKYVSLIGLRDGSPRGRRGANRYEWSFRRRPLVLCRVSDFDCRWACHLELQAQLVGTIPVHLGGGNRLGKSPIRELVIPETHVRLHKVRKIRDEVVLNVLDVERTVQKVSLRFHAVTKGRERLVALLLHRNAVLVGVVLGVTMAPWFRLAVLKGVPTMLWHAAAVVFPRVRQVRRTRPRGAVRVLLRPLSRRRRLAPPRLRRWDHRASGRGRRRRPACSESTSIPSSMQRSSALRATRKSVSLMQSPTRIAPSPRTIEAGRWWICLTRTPSARAGSSYWPYQWCEW